MFKSSMKQSTILNLMTIDEDEAILAETPKSIQELCKSLLFPLKSALNIEAKEFIPTPIKSTSIKTITLKPKQNKYIKTGPFIPKYTARAHLNIFIGKKETKIYLDIINEIFEDTSKLYYYLDGTVALQIHDKQMNIFQKSNNEKVVFINLDLHKKNTNQVFYGVVVPNDDERVQKCNKDSSDKWLWKLDALLTAKEIEAKYEITDLPKSSRTLSNGLHSEIQKEKTKLNITPNILFNIDCGIQQIGSSTKHKKNKQKKSIVSINMRYWVRCIENSWNDFELIPMICYDNNSNDNNNKYWIEWVKLIYIPSKRSYIGISYKYNSNGKNSNGHLWNLQAIYLDKGAIYNKYRLSGLTQYNYNHYMSYFNNYKFNTSITHINWV